MACVLAKATITGDTSALSRCHPQLYLSRRRQAWTSLFIPKEKVGGRWVLYHSVEEPCLAAEGFPRNYGGTFILGVAKLPHAVGFSFWRMWDACKHHFCREFHSEVLASEVATGDAWNVS